MYALNAAHGKFTKLWKTDRAAQARAARDRLEAERPAEGPVEEMIVAGTAFGFGLFNLVFSLLPKKVQWVLFFVLSFWFTHIRPTCCFMRRMLYAPLWRSFVFHPKAYSLRTLGFASLARVPRAGTDSQMTD
ncbi:hypothetical protein FB451DRAFT_1556987 [Mycena latifolia]|nr:hypothetical protein FB451DRAFT_1556987 [Mycena latifolia]